jgi:hypothetical protein
MITRIRKENQTAEIIMGLLNSSIELRTAQLNLLRAEYEQSYHMNFLAFQQQYPSLPPARVVQSFVSSKDGKLFEKAGDGIR